MPPLGEPTEAAVAPMGKVEAKGRVEGTDLPHMANPHIKEDKILPAETGSPPLTRLDITTIVVHREGMVGKLVTKPTEIRVMVLKAIVLDVVILVIGLALVV
jgi:hypothetical protein